MLAWGWSKKGSNHAAMLGCWWLCMLCFGQKISVDFFFWEIKNLQLSVFFVFHNHHHHHHLSVMELGHLLARSGLTYPEVSSKVCHDSFCQLGNSVSLSWVIYYGAFYLHVVSSFSYIPVICLKLVLFLIPLQFVHLFFNFTRLCT